MKETTERNTNYVRMTGTLEEPFSFHHTSHGKNFYQGIIRTERLSGTADIIPVIASEDLVKDMGYQGCPIDIKGHYQSFNDHSKGRTYHKLFVFAIRVILNPELENTQVNSMSADGYVCAKPLFRTTHRGRKITDVMMAVNRRNGKADYIPLILWGGLAEKAKDFEIGRHIQVKGRIQSRDYTKHLDDEHTEQRTAYEVSVNLARKMPDTSKAELSSDSQEETPGNAQES